MRNAQPISVVLVEDDEDDYILTRELLDEIDQGRFELRWVSAYEEAVGVLRQVGVDVYLVDYRLGGRSGLDLLREALSQGVRAPIIVLTGQGNREVDLEAMQAGAADYLIKGEINSYLLERAIRYAVERRQADDKLRESEERYRGIVEDQTELVCRFRADGTLTLVNRAYSRYFDQPGEALIGQAFTAAVLDADRGIVERALAGCSPVLPLIPYYEHRVRLADGQVRWQQWTGRAIFDEHGQLVEFQAVGRDVTDRRLAEAAEREQRALAEALRDTAESLSQTLNLDEVLDRILVNVGQVIPHDAANIMFIDAAGQEARVVRQRGEAEAARAAALLSLRLPIGRFRSLQALVETGQPLVIADTQIYAGWLDLPETRWIRSYLGLPIRIQGRVIGLLNINSATAGFFTPAHAERLRAFADQAATAIQNSELYDSVRRHAARAEALARTAARLNVQLDLDKVLDAICEETAQALAVPVVGVRLYDAARQAFFVAATFGLPPHYQQRAQPIPSALYERVTDRTEPTVYLDVQAIPDLVDAPLLAELNIRTVAVAALVREGQTIGGLNAATLGQVRVFTADEQALLQALAAQAAQAIANAQHFEEARRRLEQVQALRAIDVAITSSLDLPLTLNVFLDQVLAQLHVDAASLLLYEARTQHLRYMVGRGFHTRAIQGTDLRLGRGFVGQAALERRIIQVPDLAQQPSGPAFTAFRLQEGFVSYYNVPLIAKSQIVGVLEIFHRTRLEVDKEWLSFLETLAGQAAIAIDGARLFSDLQRSNLELQLAYDTTLEGWSRALDLRDKETEGHTQRVTAMTIRLARMAGMSEAQIVQVQRGALLHDIGKMGIPDSILLKAGPLSDEEWVIMRKHPTYAYELLYPIVFLRPALDIPHAHHEKWDGTGYPRGLKGEQIPPAARLFAVVDVWDALCSDRPYRPGWPVAQVLEHIQALSGRHFDPRAVEVFLEALNAVDQSP